LSEEELLLRKQAKLQWFQNPGQISGVHLNLQLIALPNKEGNI